MASKEIVDGHTELSLAIYSGKDRMAEELLKNGSNANGLIPSLKHNNMSYLLFSCLKKNLNLVKVLIQHGADINATYQYDDFNLTTLQWLIKPSNDPDQIKIFLELLKHGADVNKVENQFKFTSVHIAAREGNSEVIKHLLSYRANINTIDITGLTPLHYAINNGHISCVILLLEAGCVVNSRNGDVSPLHFATVNKNDEIVSKLIEYGAKFNAQDSDGKSPLHYALLSYSELNKIECVKIVSRLLKEPVDLNLKCKNGKTALELAFENNCYDIVKMLTHKLISTSFKCNR